MLTERQFTLLENFIQMNPGMSKGDTWCYDKMTKQIYSPLSESRLNMLSLNLPPYKVYKKINIVRLPSLPAAENLAASRL